MIIGLGAIGNRCWGAAEGTRTQALFLMSMGTFIGSGLHIWALPLIILTLFFFRCWATTPWLDLISQEKKNWGKAFIRGLAILPHAALMCALTLSILPWIIGVLLVFVIPFIYYAAGKYAVAHNYTPEAVATAEFVSGFLICTL